MDGPAIPSKSRLMCQGFEVQERGMRVVSNIEEDGSKADVVAQGSDTATQISSVPSQTGHVKTRGVR